MNIAEEKMKARKAAFERRKAAFENVSYDISAELLALTQNHEIISAYMPMRTEISPLAAMNALVENHKRVCVPIIQGKGKPLKFFEWTPDCIMEEGAFGAQIPKATLELTPDFVFAPMVAFDDAGTRLGYGGGFYDRTLETLRQSAEVPYVGLAYEAQKSQDRLPIEPTDIPLDGILTENGYRVFNR